MLDLLGHTGGDPVTVCWQDPGGVFTVEWTTADKAPDVADDHPDANVWFNVNALQHKDSGRGSVADVTRLAALHADLDVKPGGLPTFEAAQLVVADVAAMLGPRPAAIIRSGHGWQPLWIVDPDDPDVATTTDEGRGRAVALLRRFGRLVNHVAEARGGRADSVFDLARVLRVPGTMNVKDHPVPAAVAVIDATRPLTVAEIDEALTAYNAVELPGDRDPGRGDPSTGRGVAVGAEHPPGCPPRRGVVEGADPEEPAPVAGRGGHPPGRRAPARLDHPG